ncbi:MAG: hypothetical protein KGL39_12835 [Patescibacteria group bacterium]|nr:hypothetical protein [Patescibacteria group bacterium]
MTEHVYVYNELGYTHDDECPACVEQTCSAGHYIGAFEDCGICKCGADYGAHQTGKTR